MAIVNIDDFFDFNYRGPINRISYTEEDAKYKLRCMKCMQDLGMKILIDDAGNICGVIKGKNKGNKSFVMGSHTDSVTDGGQFDGPVGVYMALKSAENYKENNNSQYGDLKVVIYACEESTRFKKACLGSTYLSGNLTYDDLSKIKDKDGIGFDEAIAEYKAYIFEHLKEYGINLNNISLVDKILEPEEVSEAVESHIEQSEILFNSNIAIGGIDSIGKPVRGKVNVSGPTSIVTSAQIIRNLTEYSKASKANSSEETVRVTVPEFNSNIDENTPVRVINSDDDSLIQVEAYGESNHSGATPMNLRKDAVLGLSDIILKLNELQKENPNLEFEFVSVGTPKWGANQIQDRANLILKIEPKTLIGVISEFADEVSEESGVKFDISSIGYARVRQNPEVEMFFDVRQQYPALGNETVDDIFEIFKTIQEEQATGKDTVEFNITSKGNPIRTNEELLENVQAICADKKYPCQVLHSWPGHDLACILPESNKIGKRILFFIPSQGGSHNPAESTSKEAIEIGTDVYTTLVSQRMNKIKKEYLEKQEER